MRPARGRALAAAAALLLCAAAGAPGYAGAQGYDPSFRWRTLSTPRFRVHFHQGEEALARRVAGAAERAHELLSPWLRHDPGLTHIVLSDDSDDANGSATPVPYNTVRLYAVAPDSLSELNDSSDWVWQLVAHEYTHILHLDTVAGIPAAVNSVLGKLWVPNALVPPWIIEGLAVLDEDVPGRGRNSSALFDMYARAMVLEGGLFRLEVASNQPLEWPLGNAWYLLGGRFLGWVEARYGPAALADFSHDQAGWVWPYAVGVVAERHLGGKDFRALWAEFAEALEARYAAQLAEVRARPVTQARWLTRRGGRVAHPRWSPGGSFLVYFDRGLEERPGLRQVTFEGRDLGRVVRIEANGALALRSAREAVVAETDVWHQYRLYDDLYLVDLETGCKRRLTDGERATDPDLGSDGATVVYVARTGPGEMALKRLRLDGGEPEVLFQRPGAQIYLPRLSPDGRRVAFELQEGGRRDVVVLEEGRLERVTDDDAIDVSPSWGPDGRLYFSSDRSGVYDVYAREPDGRLRQVTNVETGALEPQVSPDGHWLAFVSYSRAGYDLALAPLDPDTWLEPAPAAPRPPGVEYDRAFSGEVRGYDPFPTLGPAFWIPALAADAAGTALGAFTAGQDVVLLHSWALQAFYSLKGQDLDYSAAYLGQWSYPYLTLSSSRWLVETPDETGRLMNAWMPAQVQLGFPVTKLERAFLATVGWRGILYHTRGPEPEPADPTAFRDGFRSELSLGLAYSDARRFVHSISAEEGRVLSLRLAYAGPGLGSDWSYTYGKASWTEYLRLPPFRHVVLGLHLSGGAATEAFPGTTPFTLGGIPAPDLLGTLLAAVGFGSFGSLADQLRGYPSGFLGGTRLLSGTAELRFPILAPEWGYSTWPAMLRRLSGAVFLDAGSAWTPGASTAAPPPHWYERLRFGTGAEARLELVLGYRLVLDLRLGVAQGLGKLLASPRPADPWAETQVYATVAQSF
ncbi:MAG TPA: BamA/TamA family outer membrane protein [Anaeromyxobacteraceae bacterium]|nr:BamA/TamA family outer membrane protein [Anaeromyxobacteraceae bacterium]